MKPVSQTPPGRLTPEREAEIRERTPQRAADLTAWLNKFSPIDGQRAVENAETVLEEDIPALLAELAAVRAERDQARRDAERQRASYFAEAARLLEDAGRDDDSVNLLDNVAAGIHAQADDASDNRRRIYIDGKGDAWISVCHDEGTEWVVPVRSARQVEQDVRDVADETGSLREIGRCW